MAGFMKFSVVGNAGGQEIVNVLWYRSDTWLPLVGNPFSQMQEAMDAVGVYLLNTWLAGLPQEYVLQRFEGVGYSDAFDIVTASPVVRTVQQNGNIQSPGHDSFAHAANIRFVLGAQHQINGIGSSKRNRGYVAYGPVGSPFISDDGHFTGTYISNLVNAVGQKLMGSVVDAGDLATLVPVRIHEKFVENPVPLLPDILVFRTYSDVLGYVLPTKVTFRRSRLPEV